jgi:hypothetical protein
MAKGSQTAPTVMVAQDHLYSPRPKSERDVVKGGDAHIRAEWNRRVLGDLGHTFDAVCWVLEVLEVDIAQFLGDANRRFDRPGRVRVDTQSGAGAESLAHELHRRHLDIGLQYSAFDLEDRHAVALGEALGLFDQFFGGERLAPFVFAGLFEEQVRRKWDSSSRGTAQQVVDRSAGGLADQVEQRNLNG